MCSRFWLSPVQGGLCTYTQVSLWHQYYSCYTISNLTLWLFKFTIWWNFSNWISGLIEISHIVPTIWCLPSPLTKTNLYRFLRIWLDGQLDFISESSTFTLSRLSLSQSLKKWKKLTVGPWDLFSSYRSFYRNARKNFPSNYLRLTLVLVHTYTWSNQSFSCWHSLRFTVTWWTPTSNSVSVQIHFCWLYTQLRLLSSIHLISLPPHTSEPLIKPLYQSESPFPIPYCKYLKIYINPQDTQEAHLSSLSHMLCEMVMPIFILWLKISCFLTWFVFPFQLSCAFYFSSGSLLVPNKQGACILVI